MKILLINPPTISTIGTKDINAYPPLGLAYLAAVLKHKEHEVKILDCLLDINNIYYKINKNESIVGLSREGIFREIEDFKPAIIGISNLFSRQRNVVRNLLRDIKLIYPNIKLVVGGAHPSATMDNYDGYADYVIIGEGESVIFDILNYKNYTSPFIQSSFIDVNILPFPAWGIVGLEKYFGSGMSHGYRKYNRFAPVQTSRGCTAKCSFCTAHKIYGRKFRARKVNDVIMELLYLKSNYSVEEIMFEDDNLTLDPKRAYDLFDQMIKFKFDLKWDTPNGVAVWTLNERLIDKMVESGCHTINFPIESGNQTVLDRLIRKPLNLLRAKELIRYSKRLGCSIGIFLVIGIPGETKKQIKETLKLAEELEIYFPHISIATPYPGSDLEKSEFIVKNDAINNYENLHIRKANLFTKEWSPSDLERILKLNRYKRIFLSTIKEPVKTYERYKRRKEKI